MELQRPHQLRDGAGVLAVGTIVGMMGAALAISFAALIFTGDMAEFLPIGAGMALAGAALSGLVIAVIGGLPGTIAGAQDNTAVIMALAVAGATGAVAGADRLPTALAVIVSGTVLAGVAMLTIGRFHLGRFVRYVPYPVIGGFLAGTVGSSPSEASICWAGPASFLSNRSALPTWQSALASRSDCWP
jgi:SulP family sulfate permease